jgi:hypothetical protein
VVPPCSDRISRVPPYSRTSSCFLPVRGYHPLWPDFPDGSGSYTIATGLVRVRSPLLTESRLMSFPPGTEMFQFPGFASLTYVFSIQRYPKAVGFPIRKSTDQRLLAPPRGLSQRASRPSSPLISMPRHPPNALLGLIAETHLNYRCPRLSGVRSTQNHLSYRLLTNKQRMRQSPLHDVKQCIPETVMKAKLLAALPSFLDELARSTITLCSPTKLVEPVGIEPTT